MLLSFNDIFNNILIEVWWICSPSGCYCCMTNQCYFINVDYCTNSVFSFPGQYMLYDIVFLFLFPNIVIYVYRHTPKESLSFSIIVENDFLRNKY